MNRFARVLIVLAGIMGADGVILAAVAAHQTDATPLLPASSMLLFHAAAVLAAVALTERGVVVAKGAEAKATKQAINGTRIYPPGNADRDAVFAASVPAIQPRPAVG